jgi:hypothetical protein
VPGRRLAQATGTAASLACCCGIALILPIAAPWVVPLCSCVIVLSAVALATAVPLAGAGKGMAPAAPLLAGWAVVIGGAGCDIFATLAHSPDLVREANPIIRSLLDNGVSLRHVFLFGATLQALFVALTMILWLGFLKHRHTLVSTMPPSGSLLTYFKAGTGGRELSYRQWICPLSYTDLPWAYHLAWWSAVAFVGVSVYRFYLALEWYSVAPTDSLGVRLIAPCVLLLALCWSYAAWLRGARASQASATVNPLNPSLKVQTNEILE